jgi:hypothetical protein
MDCGETKRLKDKRAREVMQTHYERESNKPESNKPESNKPESNKPDSG